MSDMKFQIIIMRESIRALRDCLDRRLEMFERLTIGQVTWLSEWSIECLQELAEEAGSYEYEEKTDDPRATAN